MISSHLSQALKQRLQTYVHLIPAAQGHLIRLLNQGECSGSGRLILMAVDQGFEHGPDKSFRANPAAYAPEYHFQLALDSGVSGLTAPLGFLECGFSGVSGILPLILKLNHSTQLTSPNLPPAQVLAASVDQAMKLGCVGVGFSLYFGSESCPKSLEEFRHVVYEARKSGLLIMVWAYPRGSGTLAAGGATHIDVLTYAVHMACLLGADIIKTKIPSPTLSGSLPLKSLIQAAFGGKRLVVFSGGEAKSDVALKEEASQAYAAGAAGAIMGRNFFQRSANEAITLVKDLSAIYRGEDS